MQVNLIGLPNYEIKEEIKKEVNNVIDSGFWRSGKIVKSFEEEIAKTNNTKYAICVSSCSAALFSLINIILSKGSKIIAPSFTFAATINAIEINGCKPIFAEVNNNFNISHSDIKKFHGLKNIDAILPVHLFGQATDIYELIEIGEKYDIKLIFDGAQAFGAKYDDKPVGYFDPCCFSFDTLKNITTGEGGVIVTNDEELAMKARYFIDNGRSPDKKHILIGTNFKMTEIQAAMGLIQLRHLNKLIRKRQKIAKLYDELLSDLPDVNTPYLYGDITHIYTFYTIIIGKKANIISANLRKKGIETKVHLPVHMEPFYRRKYRLSLPTTERLSEFALSLPMHPYLSEEEIKFVVDELKKVLVNK